MVRVLAISKFLKMMVLVLLQPAFFQEAVVPRFMGRSYPFLFPNLTEALRKNVKHDRIPLAQLAKLRRAQRDDGAGLIAAEDTICLENGNFKLTLEPLEQAEHPIDRTP